MDARSLGRVFEPLSFCCPGSRRRRVQSLGYVEGAAREVSALDQPARPSAGTKGMAQLLGNPAHASKIVSGAIELRAPERGQAWAGEGCEPLSLVLRRLVRANGEPCSATGTYRRISAGRCRPIRPRHARCLHRVSHSRRKDKILHTPITFV